MDTQTRLFLWAALGTLAVALILGGFGLLVGIANARQGRRAGTRLALSAVRAFERLGGPMRDTSAAALAGFIDGAAFGAVVGCALGIGAGLRTPHEGESLGRLLLGLGVLAALALLLGGFALALAAGGTSAVGAACAGAALGASLGAYIRGTDGLFAGLLVGGLLGAVGGFVAGRGRRG